MLNFGFKRKSLGAPNASELIAAYRGTVSSDGSKLLAKSGNHSTDQVAPTSVLFDGAGIGTLAEPGTDTATRVVIPEGDFELSGQIEPSLLVTEALLSGGDTTEGVITLATNGDIYFYINGAAHILPTFDGSWQPFLIKRVGGVLSSVVGEVTNSVACDTSAIVFRYVGAYQGTAQHLTGNLSDLLIVSIAEDGTRTTLLDLAMTCKSTEYSSTPNLPDCVWSGFGNMDPEVIYEEHFCGTKGSDRFNQDGGSFYENLLPYADPSNISIFSADDGVTIEPATGDLANFVDNATVFEAGSSIYAYQTVDNVATPRKFHCYVEMDDGEAPVPGGVSTDPNFDFSISMNGDGAGLTYTVEHIQGAVYRCTAYRDSTDANYYYGIVKYAGQSNRSFKCSRFHLTENDGEYTETTGTPITGRQPAGWNGLTTQYPGPIAYDWTARRVALQGDGALYVTTDAPSDPTAIDTITINYTHGAIPSATEYIVGAKANDDRFYISTTAENYFAFALGETITTLFTGGPLLTEGQVYVISLYAKSGSYVLTVDGVEEKSGSYTGTAGTATYGLRLLDLNNTGSGVRASNGTLNDVKTYLAGTLVNHWHLEDGVPYETGVVKCEDIVGGNHGTVVGVTSEADIWTYVAGPSRRLLGYNKNQNLMPYGNDLTGWSSAYIVTVTADTITFPNTSNPASLKQDIDGSLAAYNTITFTVEMKGPVGETVTITPNNQAAWNSYDTSLDCVLTDEWVEYTLVSTALTSSTNCRVHIGMVSLDGTNTGNIFEGDVNVRNAHLVDTTDGEYTGGFVETTGTPITGYQLASHADSSKDIHGIDLEYRQGQWQTALQSKIEFTPPLNKYSCYNHGQNPIRLDDQPALSISQNTAIGDKAMVDYFDDDPILGEELWVDLVADSSFSEDDGVITLEGVAGYISTGVNVTIGDTFLFTYDSTLLTGAIQADAGDATLTASGVGRDEVSGFITATTTGPARIYSNGATGTIDNISVRKYDDTQTGVIADIIPAVDKYAGILGEELTTNPSFDNNIDNWTSFDGVVQEWDNGKLALSGGTNYVASSRNPTIYLEAGWYNLTASLFGTNDEAIRIYVSQEDPPYSVLGNVQCESTIQVTENDVFEVASSGTYSIKALPYTCGAQGGTAYFDNISVKQITRDET